MIILCARRDRMSANIAWMLLVFGIISCLQFVNGQQKIKYAKKDLGILIGSSAISGLDNSIVAFVKNVIGRLKFGWDMQALVHYDRQKQVVFNFTTFSKRKQMYEELQNIDISYNTSLEDGIRALRTATFAEGNGERPDVPNVALVLTDGTSNTTIAREAMELKNANVIVYAIGTYKASMSDLAILASAPENILPLVDFSSISSLAFLDIVMDALCVPDNTPASCQNPNDLVFILDHEFVFHMNRKSAWYNDIPDFVSNIVTSFDLSPDKTRVGMVIFGSGAYVSFDLTTHKSLSTLIPAIRNMPVKTGRGNIAEGLRVARTDVFGGPRSRSNVTKVAVVMREFEDADYDQNATLIEATNLKAAGVEIFIARFSYLYASTEAIASKPLDAHLYIINDILDLNDMWWNMSQNICHAKGEPYGTITPVVKSGTCYWYLCQYCKNPDFCDQCETSTSFNYPIKGNCEPSQCTIPDCRLCFDSSSCFECNTGYHTELCHPVCELPFCDKCDVPNECSRCSNGYNFDANSGTCIAECTDTACLRCDYPERSEICAPGFILISQECHASDVPCNVEYCQYCASNQVCSHCIHDHHFVEINKCSMDCFIPCCQNCSAPNVCSICNRGFYLDANLNCVATGKEDECPVQNCQECSLPSVCSICNRGYNLDTYQNCIASCKISSCEGCLQPDVCSKCLNGYILDDKGKCSTGTNVQFDLWMHAIICIAFKICNAI